jgi:polysaccharide biosynthesis/export protein
MSQTVKTFAVKKRVSAFLGLVIGVTLALGGCASVANAPVDGAVAEATVTSPGGGFWQTVVQAGPQTVALPGPEHVGQVGSWGQPGIVAGGVVGPKAVAATDGPYLLDTGDRLRVFVYGQPNLSRLYIVDHDGKITVPLIGAVRARAHTTYQLEGMIRAKLGSQFVKDPQVTVDVQQNRPFFILGEVRNAGQYPYVSGMTAETAVAIAGGFSERANERKVRITRRIDGTMEVIEAPTDYVVQPGDTVYIFERFF